MPTLRRIVHDNLNLTVGQHYGMSLEHYLYTVAT